MKNIKMQIVQEIIGLRFELDNYRNDRDWVMVRKIRLEIARLENLLSETYWVSPEKGVDGGRKVWYNSQ